MLMINTVGTTLLTTFDSIRVKPSPVWAQSHNYGSWLCRFFSTLINIEYIFFGSIYWTPRPTLKSLTLHFLIDWLIFLSSAREIILPTRCVSFWKFLVTENSSLQKHYNNNINLKLLRILSIHRLLELGLGFS